mmetsp:Transcript_18325/g.44242  ORF Transcript_18325/g.44242 Transcript_18325/m.44242 type:complete len:222 (-) Transcript_18325:1784-2449(-)
MSVLSSEVLVHIGGYIALNFVKSVCGCGLIGYGVTRLQQASLTFEKDHRNDRRRRRRRRKRSNNDSTTNENDDDDDDDYIDNGSDDDPDQQYAYVVEYVIGSMVIGLGLVLAVPSLLSEGFIESAGCVATTSNVVSDTTSNNVLTYVKSWTSPFKDFVWKSTGDGGGTGGSTGASTSPGAGSGGGVGNLLRGETSTNISSNTPKINLSPVIDRVINKSGPK